MDIQSLHADLERLSNEIHSWEHDFYKLERQRENIISKMELAKVEIKELQELGKCAIPDEI